MDAMQRVLELCTDTNLRIVQNLFVFSIIPHTEIDWYLPYAFVEDSGLLSSRINNMVTPWNTRGPIQYENNQYRKSYSEIRRS